MADDTIMSKEEYALEWLRFSEMDLSSAEYLCGHRPLPVEIICYHCQQSSEKILKGILVLNDIIPPKIHELEELFSLCKPFVQNIEEIWKECNYLNKYSVLPRYPEEIEITTGDMKDALEYAKRVLTFFKLLYPSSEGENG